MINREMKPMCVLTYGDSVDEWGQKRKGVATKRFGDMVVKQCAQHNVADPRYVDVEYIGLTKDFAISDKNVIEIDEIKYNVLFVIPSGRFLQVFMKKVR